VSVLLWELGPTLTWSGLGLLVVGAVLASVLIFGPAHKRLRSLGEATKAIGEGRTEVRASEAGGDEVTALAQAFNKMASDLETRASALAASDEARRQLLADVSHELMTPLTAIRGYVQTLAMPHATADESARARYLSIIDQETYKLETIIGDLLDLARLEGGGGELVLEKVPVTELFRRVLDRHGPEIHDRGLSMVTAATPDDLHVRGDANRLEQVLQNIAANAIRHTPRGGRIELTAEHRADFVRIAVRDTGSGIPEEHLPHVFDRFYKADRSRTHVSHAAGDRTTPGGSGLGLSIVRAIVRRHGGTVSAHNVPEGGALFEILLPVEKGTP
jgi:signal transduction histidine kinase